MRTSRTPVRPVDPAQVDPAQAPGGHRDAPGASAEPAGGRDHPTRRHTYDPARPLPRATRLRGSAWARQVDVQVTNIDGRRMAALGAPVPGQTPETRDALNGTIFTHLQAARRATEPTTSGLPWLCDWWRGTSIEHAFTSIHSARADLVDLAPDDYVRSLVPDAVARVGSYLQPADPRRRDVERLLQHDDPTRCRAQLRLALQTGYAVSDESHARLRAFRNVLVAASLLITFFVLGFIVLVRVEPGAVPMCFNPRVSSVDADQAARRYGGEASDYADRTVCPTGEELLAVHDRLPGESDVVIVAGLGVVGGALASTVSIRKLTGKVTPYGIPVALALLKLPIGALTAISGIILLGGAFVPGLSELDSQRQILAYALVLGFAQQLVTQFIDRRASTLIAEVPSKSTPRPTPSPASPVDGSAS